MITKQSNQTGGLPTPTLRFLGLGYVAENKALDRHDVQILPYELLNMKDGELGTLTYDIESSGIDVEEKFYQEKIELGDTIRATFIDKTNLETSPDVRRGEKVYLYQQGNSDLYFWDSMGMDDDLRRLETVRFSWSDIPENVDEELSPDNTYYLEVSTHKGLVTFSTCTRNEEHTTYLWQFNTKDGQFTLKDGKENIIQMDSRANTLWFQNQEGSTLEINREDIYMIGVNSITLEAPNITTMSESLHMTSTDMVITGVNLNIAYQAISQGPTVIEGLQGPVLGTPLFGPISYVPPQPPYAGIAAPWAVPLPRVPD